jgi:hypothetical protein
MANTYIMHRQVLINIMTSATSAAYKADDPRVEKLMNIARTARRLVFGDWEVARCGCPLRRAGIAAHDNAWDSPTARCDSRDRVFYRAFDDEAARALAALSYTSGVLYIEGEPC